MTGGLITSNLQEFIFLLILGKIKKMISALQKLKWENPGIKRSKNKNMTK